MRQIPYPLDCTNSTGLITAGGWGFLFQDFFYIFQFKSLRRTWPVFMAVYEWIWFHPVKIWFLAKIGSGHISYNGPCCCCCLVLTGYSSPKSYLVSLSRTRATRNNWTLGSEPWPPSLRSSWEPCTAFLSIWEFGRCHVGWSVSCPA